MDSDYMREVIEDIENSDYSKLCGMRVLHYDRGFCEIFTRTGSKNLELSRPIATYSIFSNTAAYITSCTIVSKKTISTMISSYLKVFTSSNSPELILRSRMIRQKSNLLFINTDVINSNGELVASCESIHQLMEEDTIC